MKIRKRTALAFVLVVGGVAASAAYYRFLMSGELGERDVYAALQTAESEGRSVTAPVRPVFIENAYRSGYALLGMPSGNERFPYVWIALNKVSKKGSVFKVPPGARGTIDCEYVFDISRRTEIEPAVFGYLKSICVNQR